jgi:hypothetical protein
MSVLDEKLSQHTGPHASSRGLYAPLEPFFDKTWRPGEIELVK